MKILLTGATGFVGRRLSAMAMERNLLLRGAARSSSNLGKGLEWAVIDKIDGRTDWYEALRDVGIVIHLAARVHVMHDTDPEPLAAFRAVNVAGTENLARQAAMAGVKRLVYVSSIKVNGEETEGGRSYRESDIPDPQDPYGQSKWEAEQALQRISAESGLEIVIVRPPLVYGPGVKGNFAQMLKILHKRMPLPMATVRNLRSLIYVDNLADVLLVCATHPKANGQTYLVSDGEDISTPDLLRRLGESMGRPARLFCCPSCVLMAAASLAGKREQAKRLLGSLQVDSGKIRQELDWQPPYTPWQGLKSTAESFRG